MKKFALVSAILLLAVGALFLKPTPSVEAPAMNGIPRPKPAFHEPMQFGTVPARLIRPRAQATPSEITLLPIAEESRNLNRPDRTPEEDLLLLEALLDGFKRASGSMPSGENAEIVSALQGTNQAGIAILPVGHPAITADGKLVDRWGTPFFFHPISSTRLEVTSAGPDRKLWTDDDVKL